MWPLILLGLGVGGYLLYSKGHAASGSTGTADSEIQKTAAYAMQNEHDPNVLKTLALKLDAAGYHDLGAQLSARADQLAHAQGQIPIQQAQAFTLGNVASVAAPNTIYVPPAQSSQLAPSLGQSSLSVHAPRYLTSGNFPNGYPTPSTPHPYVTITTPIRR